MRILVVDDEPEVLAEIVAKIRSGWESERREDDLDIEQADSIEAVRKLVEKHREDRDWVLDHVFSDGLMKAGRKPSYGCNDVYQLVREKGPNGTSPGMTVVSSVAALIQREDSDLTHDRNVSFFDKSEIHENPRFLIEVLHPPRRGSLEIGP